MNDNCTKEYTKIRLNEVVLEKFTKKKKNKRPQHDVYMELLVIAGGIILLMKEIQYDKESIYLAKFER